jgi:hypothetical protein
MRIEKNVCQRCGGVILVATRGREFPGQMWTPDGAKPLCGCLPKQGEKWRINPDETHIGAVTFTTESQTSSDSSLKIEARTRWDGCTDLYLTEREVDREDEESYHHICDLDEFIATLQSVRKKARSYFYGEFSVATISEEERLRKIAAFQQEEQE